MFLLTVITIYTCECYNTIIVVVAVFMAEIVVLFVLLFRSILSFLLLLAATDINQGVELEPEFIGSISNVTVPVGRDAVLVCSVKNLGKYKVSVSNYSVLTLIHLYVHT